GHVGGPRRHRARHAGRRPHDGGGRAQRRHGPDAGADRALPRRRGGAHHRMVHQGVRAGADGGARPRHRRRGGPHVHADLRACREHPLTMVVENIAELSAKFRMPALSLEQLREQQVAFDLIPYSEAARRSCIALRDAEGAVSVVLGDPFDLDAQDWIEQRLVAPFRYWLASREDVAAFLAQQEAGFRALDGVSKNVAAEDTFTAQEISFEATVEADSTVVKLVSSTLYDALKAGASDVHLESTAHGLSIKYRVDGVLTAAETMPGTELAEQVISRIKVMSELDIAERR